jgi:hypothetical protein
MHAPAERRIGTEITHRTASGLPALLAGGGANKKTCAASSPASKLRGVREEQQQQQACSTPPRQPPALPAAQQGASVQHRARKGEQRKAPLLTTPAGLLVLGSRLMKVPAFCGT